LNELDAMSPSPVCTNADRLQREPAKDWRQATGSHGNVINPLDAAAAPTFFWGGQAATATGNSSPLA